MRNTTKASTTTDPSPMRWTRATQGRTWDPDPDPRHIDTRRTTLDEQGRAGLRHHQEQPEEDDERPVLTLGEHVGDEDRREEADHADERGRDGQGNGVTDVGAPSAPHGRLPGRTVLGDRVH